MYEAISVCKAGVEISEIGNTIQDVAHGHGYRPMKNSCGRGIGKYLHMLPEVKVSRLREKMLYCIIAFITIWTVAPGITLSYLHVHLTIALSATYIYCTTTAALSK